LHRNKQSAKLAKPNYGGLRDADFPGRIGAESSSGTDGKPSAIAIATPSSSGGYGCTDHVRRNKNSSFMAEISLSPE
jgi:hypothetical protein